MQVMNLYMDEIRCEIKFLFIVVKNNCMHTKIQFLQGLYNPVDVYR